MGNDFGFLVARPQKLCPPRLVRSAEGTWLFDEFGQGDVFFKHIRADRQSAGAHQVPIYDAALPAGRRRRRKAHVGRGGLQW